ncbi:MAG: precorrin-6y C5,15-methyltransferase (decarboxylating) subunit CbiE [Treponema sp.]|jgi:precorrin-6Y C5,15-methyltransferase (decarboxylating)|nr:precorrin-6y C5,15-methyltransferase (decarboxylating) subunit CbiE [Treponema sp.]
MKKIMIIGTGLGPDTITAEGWKALEEAEVWFGSERVLELFKPGAKKAKSTFPFYTKDRIIQEIDQSKAHQLAILVSGDSGFYSAANELYGALSQLQNAEVAIIPGISTVSAFFARLGLPWQEVCLFSAHGRDITGLVSLVRRNSGVFCITGGNTKEIGALLEDAGFASLTVYVGENLGFEKERLFSTHVTMLRSLDLSPLSVLFFENTRPDDRIRFGIEDEAFSRREGIPMTKAAVRAAVLAKLALRSEDICYDIGAGTGSISVEMALAAHKGQVFAIEKHAGAVPLIHENRKKFNLGNVMVIGGEAPAALAELPKPDAVFIGGSAGNMKEIIQSVGTKNPALRMVITAITIETVQMVLSCLPQAELIQLSAAQSKKVGSQHLLIAQNPVFIMTVQGGLEP